MHHTGRLRGARPDGPARSLLLDCSARKATAPEESRQIPSAFAAKDAELRHDFACELDIAQAAGRDQTSVADRRCVDVGGIVSVAGHLLPEIGQSVAGMPTPANQADAGDHGGGAANIGAPDALPIEWLRRRSESQRYPLF